MGYIYVVQSFPCLVKLSLAVLGWTTHLVLEHEGWDMKRSYERVLELSAPQECGRKRKKLYGDRSWTMEKNNAKSYSLDLEKQ